MAEFKATLLWDRAEDAPQEPVLRALPHTFRCSVVETGGPGPRREILGEVLALTPRGLGSALQTVLRSLTDTAALSGALVEASVVRLAQPRATPSRSVQTLALDLWNAGFPVCFGPSWTPSPEGKVVLGFRGAEDDLRRFLEAHPSWEMA